MWERFTENAKLTVFYAQQEAGQMETKEVASEHLLLGLLRQVQQEQGQVWPPSPTDRVDPINVASRVLEELGLELDAVREEVARRRPSPVSIREGDANLTPDAKRVIDLSYKEARRFSVPHIGTEHLLLGLISEESGLAGRILAQHGADLIHTRAYLAGADCQLNPPAADTSGGGPGFWKRLFRPIFPDRHR